MKFFVPIAENREQAEDVYDAIKAFAKENTGWDVTDRRIYSITYFRDGVRYHAEVGKYETETNDLVVAILDSTTYLVCTANRGVARGAPILVGKHQVVETKGFDK